MKLEYVGTGRMKLWNGATIGPPAEGEPPATVEVSSGEADELLARDKALSSTNWRKPGSSAVKKKAKK